MSRAWLVAVVVALLSGGTWLHAQSPRSAEAQFRAAQYKADIEGDLRAAIDEFKNVIALAGSNRAIAAEAWLQVAECYRKLGDASQARLAYRRVVTEFTDQPKSLAAARNRLGPESPVPAAMALRRVAGYPAAAVAPDGQWLAHYGRLGQQLLLRNLTSGVDRQLDAAATIGEAKYSRDGTQVAYTRCRASQDCELSVVDVRDSKPAVRTILKTEDGYPGAIDWTPDGTTIAVFVNRRADRTLQFGLVGASGEKTLRVLRTFDWGGGAIGGVFSPDGRDIALNARSVQQGGKRDIVLIATDASRALPLVTHPADDFALGWTPDGKHLLFGTDRNGAVGVWSQPVIERVPQGTPSLIKDNVGADVGLVGMSAAGSLYLAIRSRVQTVEVASVDLATGTSTSEPVRPIRAITDYNFAPGWSIDGRSLTYTSSRRGENILGIHTVDSAVERELNLSASLDRVASQISAAPDGSYMAFGRDLRGRYATFRIESAGTVTPLEFHDPAKGRPGNEGFFWSPDGAKVYYRLATSGLGSIHEMDLSSRNTRPLVKGQFRSISLSPDGRQFVAIRPEASGGTAVLIVGLDGTEREIMRGASSAPQWTPDGRNVLALSDGQAGLELWLLGADGVAKRRLHFVSDRIAKDFQWFRVRPDGRQIAYVVGEDRSEVWALEHFLPLTTPGR